MRRQYVWVLGLVLLLVLAGGVGCKKKPVVSPTVPPPPQPSVTSPTPPPVPTVKLTATPGTIERGQTTTLQWSSTGARTLTLEPGLGQVTPEASGSMSVSPYETMTYRIIAQGPGGSAQASATVTVSPHPEPVAPPTPRETPIPQLFAQNVRDIYFDYDKFDVRPDAIPVLQQNADFLRKYPQVAIVIEGHCDERGSAEYNIGLGDKRASVTKDYLVSLGIGADRIRVISYGKEKPICTEATDACWQQNRRAHFVLQQ
jgi:peptidoglycan-associated lipoprotein